MTKKSNSLIHKKIFKIYKIKSRRLFISLFFYNCRTQQKIKKLLDCKSINKIIIFLIRMPLTMVFNKRKGDKNNNTYKSDIC